MGNSWLHVTFAYSLRDRVFISAFRQKPIDIFRSIEVFLWQMQWKKCYDFEEASSKNIFSCQLTSAFLTSSSVAFDRFSAFNALNKSLNLSGGNRVSRIFPTEFIATSTFASLSRFSWVFAFIAHASTFFAVPFNSSVNSFIWNHRKYFFFISRRLGLDEFDCVQLSPVFTYKRQQNAINEIMAWEFLSNLSHIFCDSWVEVNDQFEFLNNIRCLSCCDFRFRISCTCYFT